VLLDIWNRNLIGNIFSDNICFYLLSHSYISKLSHSLVGFIGAIQSCDYVVSPV